MERPSPAWIVILLAVLAACAIALTLAGASSATTFGATGGTPGPAARPTVTAPGITGGTAAPANLANTPQTAAKTPKSSLQHKSHASSGWDTTGLIILAALILMILFFLVIARPTVGSTHRL